MMVSWRSLSLSFEFTTAICSFVLNGTVIYLCLYKISDQMKSYRPMLIFGCTIDTIYTLVSAICQIAILDNGTRMIFIMDSPFLPQTYAWTVVAVCVWLLSAHAMIHNVSTQFVNRLNMICWRCRYSTKQIMLFFVVCFVWSTAHSINVYFTCNEHDDPALTRELKKNPILYNTTIPQYIAGNTLKLPMILELINIQMILTLAYVTIIYSGYKIRKKLQEDRPRLQQSTIRSQIYLSRIMTIQAIIPLISIIFPAAMADFLPMISVSFDYLPVFIKLTVGLTPILNPLVVLIVIPRFRSTIINLFLRNSNSSIEPTLSGRTNPKTNQMTT